MKALIEKGRDIFAPKGFGGETIHSQVYTRKKIYKGKIAPKGTVFIQLRVKTATRVVTMCKHIPGSQSEAFENQIKKMMLDEVCKQYNLTV